MSAFDIDTYKAVFDTLDKSGRRAAIVKMARTAETAERYEDMCQFMKMLVKESDGNLSIEERNYLSVAYKNVISTRRTSWRTCKDEMDDKDAALSDLYQSQIESELDAICKEVLSLLIDYLINEGDENREAQVFYLKMAADYYRYLAECVTGKGHDASATKYYKQAFEIAKSDMPPTNPIRLGLALNYSVCLYEILQQKEEACTLAKSAFDNAISQLDQLEEGDYKDSTLIMQLLRDNLTLWTSSGDGADDDEDEN